jgi:dethiobiotin synthetase
MPGLTILAASPAADAEGVAGAVCAVLRDRGSDATPFVPYAAGAPASPLVAARHAGSEIDPAAVMDGARVKAGSGEVLVSALGGGVLAPLTRRYAVRDLARDIGAPVVVAAVAEGGAAGQARLAVEAARGAGLHVAGVVLTGWPDQPDRVLLDERRVLGELLATDVEVLSAANSDAAPQWPVDAWLEPPAGDGAGAAAAPAAEIVLEPYTAWEPHAVADPRTARRPEIMAAMLEIVAAEGPMRATRAYSLYNRASGGRKLTSVARAPLSSALYWLAREKKVMLTPESEIPWQGDDLVRLPDTPSVRVRELGPRVLEEVPLDEVAELVGRIRTQRGLTDPAEIKRAVLGAYGLVRLTARADEYLTLAIDLAE